MLRGGSLALLFLGKEGNRPAVSRKVCQGFIQRGLAGQIERAVEQLVNDDISQRLLVVPEQVRQERVREPA